MVPAQKLEKQVKDIHLKLNNVIRTSVSKVGRFPTGNIKKFLESWKKLTSDKCILDVVKNELKLEFN